MTGFPTVEAPRAWPAPLRPLTALGVLVSVFITLSALLDLALAWGEWHSYGVLEDYLHGSAVRADLTAADRLVTAVSLSGIAVQAFAGIAFLIWLWWARGNSEVLSLARHRHTRGWTIGGWFCPGVNLWFPQRIVTDVWRTSRPEAAQTYYADELPGSPLVTVWWVLFLGSALFDRYVISFGINRATSPGDLHDGAIELFAGAVVRVVAVVLVVLIIRRIAGWQRIPRLPERLGATSVQS